MGNGQSFCFVVTLFLYSPPPAQVFVIFLNFLCLLLFVSSAGIWNSEFDHAGQEFHY